MLIDDYLNTCQFSEFHEIEIESTADAIFHVIKTINFKKSKVIKFLFGIRGLPKGMETLDGFIGNGFMLLQESQNKEIVLGFLMGWGGLKVISPDEFKKFNESGFIKGVWNFRLSGINSRVRLSTETRVYCPTKLTKMTFSIYWFIISFFSGRIRKIILKMIKQAAEN